MSKDNYTVKTEGSRTVVRWRGKLGKEVARRSSSGRFVDVAPKSGQVDAPAGRPKKRAR